MQYSYKWLKELSGTQKSPEELVEFLTMRAFEVESIEKTGFDNDLVVIGEVRELAKHPNADRLRVAKIDVGGGETLQIVCGAPNIAIAQKVPVARVGAVLPGGFEIKQSLIRDVESSGMVCSQRELGLGEDHEGIMVLAESATAGTLLRDFLDDVDWLFDIKVLPDRAHDALSHVGMAREIAALEGGELDFDYDGLRFGEQPRSRNVHVEIASESLSRRFSAAFLRDVQVKQSPVWLRNRLKKIGLRSINNIVDVTNFVMAELGQPMHAYDWAKLAKRDDATDAIDIAVRNANEGEIATLLDGTVCALAAEDIVIADGVQMLSLAGLWVVRNRP